MSAAAHSTPDLAVLRLVEARDASHPGRGYRTSWEARDDDRVTVRARCDLFGRPEFATTTISDEAGRELTFAPTRRVMPNEWVLSDAQAGPVFVIRRASAAALMNPLARRLLTIRDVAAGRELDLVDGESSTADLLLGAGTLRWQLHEAGRLVAGIETRPRPEAEAPPKGLLGRVRRFFTPADWSLVSPAGAPALPAPAFIAMMLIRDALTKPAGGE